MDTLEMKCLCGDGRGAGRCGINDQTSILDV